MYCVQGLAFTSLAVSERWVRRTAGSGRCVASLLLRQIDIILRLKTAASDPTKAASLL